MTRKLTDYTQMQGEWVNGPNLGSAEDFYLALLCSGNAEVVSSRTKFNSYLI